jgi:hypothetical protein
MAELDIQTSVKNAIVAALNDFATANGKAQLRSDDAKSIAFNAAKQVINDSMVNGEIPNNDAREAGMVVGGVAVRRVGAAVLQEATKNVGKQLVKAHFREGGKVAVKAYFRRAAARGGASMMPGIGQIMFAINVADGIYTGYQAYKNRESIYEAGRCIHNWLNNISDEVDNTEIDTVIYNMIDTCIEELLREKPILLIRHVPRDEPDAISRFDEALNLMRFENNNYSISV